jgi:hypothetical protein
MPWKFKMLTNSAIGKISIIDENYTPASTVSDYAKNYTNMDDSTGVYKFTGIGTDSILQDVKIQSKLPTELQTMAYYSTLGTGNEFGAETQMFNMYRAGVVDRLRSISNIVVLGSESGSDETRMKAESELILSYSDLLEQTRKGMIVDNATEAISAGESTAKQFVRKYIHGDTVITKGFRPPIPIDVSLSLHGISGIYMGNAIMIKTIDEGGILPNRYKSNVALQATAVDHSITPTGWTTSIDTLMRQLPEIERNTRVTATRDAVVRHDETASIYKWAQNFRANGISLRKPNPIKKDGDQALADSIGIPVNILRAVRAVESGAKANVLRFEPHVWKKKSYGGDGTYPVTGFTPAYNSEGKLLSYSLTPSETNRDAFLTNYAINPTLAVKSTSFGFYQVLGNKGIKQYGSAAAFWNAFQADPAKASDKMLKQWFAESSKARKAANVTPVPDFVKLAEAYNGSGQAKHHYDSLIAEAFDKATHL